MSQPSDNRLRFKLYKEMLRIRIVEETIAGYYGEQEMRCPVHLSIGQEAAEAGACAALEQRDYVLSGHRSHGHYLAKGGNLKAMMAEIYGKATGCAGGKGGSMHLVDLDAGFLGAAPIVGSTIPIAAGVAFAAQMRNEDRVVMVFLGDGATETGVFFESINFASLKNLPIVFLVENNFYSVYSPMNVRQKGDHRIVDIARAHGMEAHQADGNDLECVHQLCTQAVTKARGGGGPSLLELITYRWREHCGPGYDNDIGYRTEAEFLSWKERDPVAAYERKLIANGVGTQPEIDRIAKDLKLEVEEAVSFAKQSPWPDLDTLSTQVYAN
ncbi:MAG: thiamine pyrophosphate-dependent dehydrogenase E1 component subunit alpha [Proteobacteria bacterium]|nr:thiamine pyrophosphate-dependent dehydrogenase E1 component subunit alpha [Pseudomonadota bacterium]